MKVILGQNPKKFLEGSSEGLLIVRITMVCLNTIFATVLCILLLCKRKQNKTYFNQIYGNLAFAVLLFSLTLRPGTITQSAEKFAINPNYCTFYVFFLEVETITIPLLILMLAIERYIFLEDRCCRKYQDIENQGSHMYKKRLNFTRTVLMILLSWAIGFITGFVKTFGLLKPIRSVEGVKSNQTAIETSTILSQSKQKEEVVHQSCNLEGRSDAAHAVGEAILFTLRSSFPVIYLGIALFVLISWWHAYFHIIHPNKKSIYNERETDMSDTSPGNENINKTQDLRIYNAGRERETAVTKLDLNEEDSPKEDDSWELPSKPTCSLIVTCLLCFGTICVTIASACYTKKRGWLDSNTQWLFFIIETCAVVLPCFLFPEIRHVFQCCSCCNHFKGQTNPVGKQEQGM